MQTTLRCLGATAALAWPITAQEKAAQLPDFEVCVVGTIHAPWQFRWRGISPAHVRAALVKLKPDVIGVESNPEWFAKGVFHEVTYEAQGVAVPFAKKHGIPVYGVDWMDVAAWDQRVADQRRRQIRAIQQTIKRGRLPTRMFGEQSPAYLVPYSELTRFFFKKDMGFAHINQIDNDDWAKQWLKGDKNAASFGGHRNQQIVKRCVEVMAKHRGKRLVVVIGAGHKAVMDVLFARMPRVKVLRLGKDIAAPTAKEIAAAETAKDLVVTLGHCLDGERACFHKQLIDTEQVEKAIERLRANKGWAAHADYFAARLAYLNEDYQSANRLLAKIGKQKPETELYPFPMRHWRMVYDFGQAVRVAKAEIAIALEKLGTAAEHLAGLAKEIGVPELPKGLLDPGPLVAEVPANAKSWSPNSSALRLIERALFLAAEQKSKPKVGMAALRHKMTITEKGPLRIECEVRSRNRARGAIEIYERNAANGHMIQLGTQRFAAGPRWDRVAASFQVRNPDKPVWIYVYLDAATGTRFGVQKITIRKANPVKVPPDWIPRMLAREYLHALLTN